jgi:hypothetical protein
MWTHMEGTRARYTRHKRLSRVMSSVVVAIWVQSGVPPFVPKSSRAREHPTTRTSDCCPLTLLNLTHFPRPWANRVAIPHMVERDISQRHLASCHGRAI